MFEISIERNNAALKKELERDNPSGSDTDEKNLYQSTRLRVRIWRYFFYTQIEQDVDLILQKKDVKNGFLVY